MPFKLISGKGAKAKYRSPSGRTFTAKQVRFYYARGSKFPARKKRRRK